MWNKDRTSRPKHESDTKQLQIVVCLCIVLEVCQNPGCWINHGCTHVERVCSIVHQLVSVFFGVSITQTFRIFKWDVYVAVWEWYHNELH